jgi:hypothetical protein
VNRRQLMLLLAGSVTAARALLAQQAMPVIGYLNGSSPAANAQLQCPAAHTMTSSLRGHDAAIPVRGLHYASPRGRRLGAV